MSIFQNTYLFRLGAIRSKLTQLYTHDLFCDTAWCDTIARPKQCWSTFPKNSHLGKQLAPSLCQNYATFCLIICSLRTFFQKEHSRYTIVTVNYAKKIFLGQIGNLDPIWANWTQFGPKLCNLIFVWKVVGWSDLLYRHKI